MCHGRFSLEHVFDLQLTVVVMSAALGSLPASCSASAPAFAAVLGPVYSDPLLDA